MIYPCIVIGAGAAGLFFGAVSENGNGGLVLEKKSRPAIKLMLSGNGQCNITHDGSIKDFIPCYGENGKRIRSCLYKYSNSSLMEFLRENDVPVTVREDGKVFPRSMKAHDIVNMLLRKTGDNGFSLLCSTEAKGIRRRADGLWQVETPAACYLCRKLILAGGGCSYPGTGSDGSLLELLARDLQIRVVTPHPALTPVNVCGYPYRCLSGISLKDVQLRVLRSGRKIAEDTGDLLFTHTNLSGPLVLNIAKEITKNDEIVLNYLYPCDKTSILDKINNAAMEKSSLLNALAKELQLPKNFLRRLLERSGESTKKLAQLLTEDRFTVHSVCGFEKAMVTCGGIALSEVDPKTMECKRYPGLFVIGELLDIDGRTGGYNLQFAYSSACAASSASLANPAATR